MINLRVTATAVLSIAKNIYNNLDMENVVDKFSDFQIIEEYLTLI